MLHSLKSWQQSAFTKRNLNNKVSRDGFSAAFLLQCMVAIGAGEIRFLP